LAQRSRKRRAGRPPGPPPPQPPRGYARSRARDEAARAALEPLAPGERPRAVTVAAIVAAVAAVANVVAAALADATPAEWRLTAAQAAVLLVAAIGMWRVKYWAVLGFQALLAFTMIIAFLSLLRAGDLAGVAFALGLVAVCAPLFWFLVRAMARIQMPERGRHQTPR
jgi:hypothetical protein